MAQAALDAGVAADEVARAAVYVGGLYSHPETTYLQSRIDEYERLRAHAAPRLRGVTARITERLRSREGRAAREERREAVRVGRGGAGVATGSGEWRLRNAERRTRNVEWRLRKESRASAAVA